MKQSQTTSHDGAISASSVNSRWNRLKLWGYWWEISIIIWLLFFVPIVFAPSRS